MPVYGLVFFVAMLLACVPRLWHTTIWWVPWGTAGHVGGRDRFSLRLIFEELFVIRSLCIWCTAAHILSFAMFVIIVTGSEDDGDVAAPQRVLTSSGGESAGHQSARE